jgi:hypothetical protein
VDLTLEQALGTKQTVSVAYIGAAGRRLLRRESLVGLNANFPSILVTRNADTSDYDALQLQFQRRLSSGLQVLASYTWGHSIDTSSVDSSNVVPSGRIDPRGDRGSSDFDVRHSFTSALTYSIPSLTKSALGSFLFRDWSVDLITTLRSATPITVLTGTSLFAVSSALRPDVVPGVPLYLYDDNLPGDRRFNRAAFISPPAGRQGTLGRNLLRGFPASQVDLAVRRQLNITERKNIQFRTEFFNLFNHPNFGDPINTLNSGALFGLSTSMLGRSLGSGGLNGGFNPLYQLGGPRSIQFGLKLQF